MRITLKEATPEEAPAIAAMRTAVAHHLLARYGKGPWGSDVTERGVRFGMKTGKVFVAKVRGAVVATLRLSTRKPWAIDRSYFTDCARPLYLTDMAVTPAKQRHGVGRQCLERALEICARWPANGIYLDAFDADAGAGGFYARCGYREVGRVTYRKCPLVYFEHML